MAETRPTRPDSDAEPQPLVGMLSNDDWDSLLVHVNSLIEEMESLPAGKVRDRVFDLLQGIDTIHRESLRRLVRLFKEGVLEKVISDPAIHTLMDLYDLLPREAEAPQEARDLKPAFPTIPIKSVRMTPATATRYPHWVPLPQSLSGLVPGTVAKAQVDDHPVIVCRRDEQFFALDSRCAQDGASLGEATLSGYTLTCPNHSGCYYDVRQGSRIGGGEKIQYYPVKLDNGGRVLIGIDMDFKPNIPSF